MGQFISVYCKAEKFLMNAVKKIEGTNNVFLERD